MLNKKEIKNKLLNTYAYKKLRKATNICATLLIGSQASSTALESSDIDLEIIIDQDSIDDIDLKLSNTHIFFNKPSWLLDSVDSEDSIRRLISLFNLYFIDEDSIIECSDGIFNQIFDNRIEIAKSAANRFLNIVRDAAELNTSMRIQIRMIEAYMILTDSYDYELIRSLKSSDRDKLRERLLSLEIGDNYLWIKNLILSTN